MSLLSTLARELWWPFLQTYKMGCVMQCGPICFPWRDIVKCITEQRRISPYVSVMAVSLYIHNWRLTNKVVWVCMKCVFLFSLCHWLRLAVSPTVGPPVLSKFQHSVFCCWWLAVTCGAMWGFLRSRQQQEEGDLLFSQLFKPVLTVLWSCVWETIWPPSPSPPLHYTPSPSLIASLFFHCSWQSTCINSWQLLDSECFFYIYQWFLNWKL